MPSARFFLIVLYQWLIRSKFYVWTSLLISVFSLYVVTYVPGFHQIEQLLKDAQLTSFSAEVQQVQDIVLIVFDDVSLNRFSYRDPIDRSEIARILKHIQQGKPKSVGLVIDLSGTTELHKDKALNLMLQSLDFEFYLPAPHHFSRPVAVQSHPVYEGISDKHLAQVVPNTDSDSVARLMLNDLDNGVPSLASALSSAAFKREPQHSPRYLKLVHAIDTRSMPFVRYSAHEVSDIPFKWFHDKVILIGLDTADSPQILLPWLSWSQADLSRVPWVDYHALSLYAIESGQAIVPVSDFFVWVLLFLFAFVCLFVGRHIALKRWRVCSVLGLVLFWYFWVDWFAASHLLLPWFNFWVVVVLGVGLGWLLRKKQYFHELQFIDSIQSAYLSFELKARLFANPKVLKRSDEVKEMVILSLRWPVPLGVQSQRAVRLELRRICLMISDFSGFVISMQSDHITAVFNSPVEFPQFKLRAVACALQILMSLKIPRVQKVNVHPLQQIKVLVVGGKGCSSPRQIIQPGGFWVAGPIWSDFKRLEALHAQINVQLLVNQMMVESLRDPNWKAQPLDLDDSLRVPLHSEVGELFSVIEKTSAIHS